MAFINAPLPPCLSVGSEGGPSDLVQISRSVAGYEQRIGKRSVLLRSYDVRYQIRRLEDLYDIYEHFIVMEGRLHSFPFRDKFDNKSGRPADALTATDVSIGVGDGVTAAFQLVKTYTVGGTTRTRNITLLTAGTELIAVDGVVKTAGTHYTVVNGTGIVTFTGGNIPTAGQAITAGYEYRVRVRYDLQDFSQVFEGFGSERCRLSRSLRLSSENLPCPVQHQHQPGGVQAVSAGKARTRGWHDIRLD